MHAVPLKIPTGNKEETEPLLSPKNTDCKKEKVKLLNLTAIQLSLALGRQLSAFQLPAIQRILPEFSVAEPSGHTFPVP